jgi:phospholipid/cholesterol/gamma-HCH transport system substrate-binding protein
MTKRNKEIVVGLFTMVAVVAVIALTLNLRQIGFLSPRYTLFLYFRDASGLSIGAPVTVYGVQAGIVKGIRWEKREVDGIIYYVVVEVDLAENIEIYENAQVKCVTAGLVGETNISIKAGDATFPRYKDGDELFGVPAPTLEEQIARLPPLFDRAEDILNGVNKLVNNDASRESFQRIVSNAESITARVDRMAATSEQELEGFLGRLRAFEERTSNTLAAADELLASSREDLPVAIRSLREQLESFEEHQEKIVTDIADATASTKRAADEVADLLTSPDSDLRRFLDSIASIGAHVDSIIRRADEGRGSMGRLLNDVRLYDNLSATAESVRSFVGGGGEPVFPVVDAPSGEGATVEESVTESGGDPAP